MARSQISDELLSYEFHIVDIDVKAPFIPPFVLWPSAGFSAISSPEMSMETTDITEGTCDFSHKVIKKASTNTITLSKGVSMWNTDFWRWSVGSLTGKNEAVKFSLPSVVPVPSARRRNLLLIHSSGLSVDGLLDIVRSPGTSPTDKIKASLILPAAGIIEGLEAASSAVSGALGNGGFGDFNFLSIPGRVYMLFECLPTRYKVGSDFDATSAAVSIEELDLSYSRFETFGLLG